MIRKQFIPLLAFSSFFLASCLQENLSTDINHNGEVALSISPMMDGAVSRTDDAGPSSSAYKGTSMSVTLWYQYDNLNEQYNKKFVEFTKSENDAWQPTGNQKLFLKNYDETDKTKFSVYVTAPAVTDPGNNLSGVDDNDTYIGKVLANQKFTIKTTQDDYNDFIASDLASYNGEKLNPNEYPDGKINISLTHRLSLLNITVSPEDGNTGNVSEVKVKSKTKVTFTTKSKPAPVLDAEDNQETYIDAYNNNGVFQVILPPQAVSNKEFITLKIGENSYAYTVPASVTHTFETQKSYTLNLVVGDAGVELGGVTVEDWEAKEISLVTNRSGKWSENKQDITINGNVYEVENGGQLYDALTKVTAGQTVKLMNDIDLSKHYWDPIGNIAGSSATNNITIDGSGNTIKGLSIDATQYETTGAAIIDAAKNLLVVDLNIDSPEIIGDNTNVLNAGVIVANASGSTGLYNCVVKDASISGDFKNSCNIGGLAGSISGGSAVVGCIFQGDISTSSRINEAGSLGGLVGKLGKSMIVASYTVCDFTNAQANVIGLFSGKRGGSATTKSTVTACIYKGIATHKPLGGDPSDYYKCVSCVSGTEGNSLSMSDLNNAINGESGYGGKTDADGPVGGPCILITTKDTYKYNFVANEESDSDTYPYIVENKVAESN